MEESTCAGKCFLMVPVTGVEPVRYRYHWILSFLIRSELDGHKVVLEVVGTRLKISPDKRKLQKCTEKPRIKIFFACFDVSEIDLQMRLKSEVVWRSKHAKSNESNLNQIITSAIDKTIIWRKL